MTGGKIKGVMIVVGGTYLDGTRIRKAVGDMIVLRFRRASETAP